MKWIKTNLIKFLWVFCCYQCHHTSSAIFIIEKIELYFPFWTSTRTKNQIILLFNKITKVHNKIIKFTKFRLWIEYHIIIIPNTWQRLHLLEYIFEKFSTLVERNYLKSEWWKCWCCLTGGFKRKHLITKKSSNSFFERS